MKLYRCVNCGACKHIHNANEFLVCHECRTAYSEWEVYDTLDPHALVARAKITTTL